MSSTTRHVFDQAATQQFYRSLDHAKWEAVALQCWENHWLNGFLDPSVNQVGWTVADKIADHYGDVGEEDFESPEEFESAVRWFASINWRWIGRMVVLAIDTDEIDANYRD